MTLQRDHAFQDNQRLYKENLVLKDKLILERKKHEQANRNYEYQKEANALLEKKMKEELLKRDNEIIALKRENERLRLLVEMDGTTAGIPTSQTPINKKKIIPNSREKTGRLKGGQPGHPKHSLPVFSVEESTDEVVHELEKDFLCPSCGNDSFTATGETIIKEEMDYVIKPVKRIHKFAIYRCDKCGEEVHVLIPNCLKEPIQYGKTVQATILSLANSANVTINKCASFIYGLTGGLLKPSEGYIAKLQKRAACALTQFISDLKVCLISQTIIYWDDTVIFINTERGIIRFYGNERIALYAAHQHKNMESLDDDNVLNLLTDAQYCMHDHNTINYNAKYAFNNLECNQHLQRDLQKVTDDTNHEWSKKLKEMISSWIHKRKEAIKQGKEFFTSEEKDSFYKEFRECITTGRKENETDTDPYLNGFERTLLNRLEKYRENYFKWIEDFRFPTTNNLSESGLRGIKSKLHACGQFESEKTAGYYAAIKTYLETCRRNGKNEIVSVQRLLDGNPYTVAELLEEVT